MMKTSYLVASGIAIAVAAWLLSGQITNDEAVTTAAKHGCAGVAPGHELAALVH